MTMFEKSLFPINIFYVMCEDKYPDMISLQKKGWISQQRKIFSAF